MHRLMSDSASKADSSKARCNFCFRPKADVRAPASHGRLTFDDLIANWMTRLVGRCVWSVQFLHRLVDGLLQAQRVSALPWWVVLQAFDLCSEKLLCRSGHPHLLGKEFAANVTPLMGLRVHLLHRIHQEIEHISNARIILLIPPKAIRLHTD